MLQLVMRAVGLALVVLLLGSCGEPGSGDRPTTAPSRLQSALPSPTATLPSATRSPEREEETRSAPAPSPTTSPAVQPTSAESSGAPSWLWWVLAAIALAVLVAVPLLVRARRRGAWRADLASAEEEVAWFARVLIPELRRST